MITVRDFKEKNETKTNEEDEVIKQKAATADDSKNKLSVINVVSATQRTAAMVPLRRFTVLKHVAPTKDKTPRPLPVVVTAVPGVGNGQVYQQRKRMLPEYKELFAALMKLPDKEIQNKLLAVINSHHSPTKYRTVETQTDPVEIKDSLCKEAEELSIRDTANGSGNETPNGKDSNTSEEMVKKRKRKRKVSLPQANKESRAKQLAKMNKPKTSMMNNGVNATATLSAQNGQRLNSPKRQRIDSFSISECSSDIVNIFDDHQTNILMEINQSNMPFENGLLPIQDAVAKNQTNKLSVHIRIWQNYRGTDLNDILTEEDEDLLQLAVINMCDPSIISLLLEEGLNPNTLDAESNTIVHLAILNDITVTSLEHLMKKIELKLLLTLNDDGYTPLHLAIRQDRYLLAECMLNILDERLMKKIFYKRQLDELETDEKVLKKHFHNYYEKICLQMALDDDTNTVIIDNHDLKQKLLQAGDRRSGNTVLYFAIDNRYEHLIYFLLAHLTDPRTENLSGLDCKSYFSEFGKSLNLSLNIDNTMEKVIKLLS
ncbi:uncharacterized protein LOC119607125 [Lucilia sericata]|uniref:uncharacterized protein LOC119607125 n=1 Tax=Lucilia sericata TaxID=13632 RepID=UPI0018A88240|nr:uncharacterized protein LOC119607125 [Lucilia sericata]